MKSFPSVRRILRLLAAPLVYGAWGLATLYLGWQYLMWAPIVELRPVCWIGGEIYEFQGKLSSEFLDLYWQWAPGGSRTDSAIFVSYRQRNANEFVGVLSANNWDVTRYVVGSIWRSLPPDTRGPEVVRSAFDAEPRNECKAWHAFFTGEGLSRDRAH